MQVDLVKWRWPRFGETEKEAVAAGAEVASWAAGNSWDLRNMVKAQHLDGPKATNTYSVTIGSFHVMYLSCKKRKEEWRIVQ